MRNALLPLALVSLLKLIIDVNPLVAQTAQAEWAARDLPASTRAQSYDRATNHAHRAAHRRRHVVHSPPNQREMAEKKGYKRVSELVNFPKFFPGLGIVFVKPDTLPLGPFLCFDRKDRLAATVYMVPIKDIDDHKTLEAPAFAGEVDHVSIYFNQGHPGVDVPHYHFVIWHVTKKDEARVAR
jgi:hypothetical protein